MSRNKGAKLVVVTGDITVDWNIARIRWSEDTAHTWNIDDQTSVFCQPGGAAMLADLIQATGENLKSTEEANVVIRRPDLPKGPISPNDDRFNHSYAMWLPFKLDESKPGQERVWRVGEYLGLCRARTGLSTSDDWKKVVDDPPEPDIIVLDDADLGFRLCRDCWPKAIVNQSSWPWIVLKMARPVAQGELYDYLTKNHANRLVVVTTANDMRDSRVHISRQLSWERTAQDVVWEVLYNPHLSGLTQCAHIIVSFDTAGAVLISRKKGAAPEATLFFDPNVMEGEWGHSHQGCMVGYTTSLIAGITRELILHTAEPIMSRAIQSGILAMRSLHIAGYGAASGGLKQSPPVFPAVTLATKLADNKECLATTAIRNPAETLSTTVSAGMPRFWTILKDHRPDSLELVAQYIVREGVENALNRVPVGRFGKLIAVDRSEIEALRGISGLIHEYCDRRQQKPLSIAVFGPPGAGKSFAVSEVAHSVRPGEIAVLSFNLSQFAGTEDLVHAFHQVRDKALSGKIPLVFWDEFDATLQNQPLGWLRYFLAPMQDGEFREGEISHPIGRCVFVFAGGTSYSMEAFTTIFNEDQRKAVKLPDFVSRLKGFLDILGPNQQHGQDGDPYYIIRRAILLRSILERNAPQLFRNVAGKRIANIDQGVLRAFLLTREYKHGARSMEAIVATSQLAGKTVFERSSLPSESQLNLHVDGQVFFSLVHRIELEKELLEKLAEAAHEVFCDNLRAEGYRYGSVTRREDKLHSSLKPYAELSDDEKEQNRNNVRDISNKLVRFGYAMLPSRSDESASMFSDTEIERLAEIEHERWMREKLNTD